MNATATSYLAGSPTAHRTIQRMRRSFAAQTTVGRAGPGTLPAVRN